MDNEIAAFMMHVYRTRACPANLDGACPFNEKTCLDCHSRAFERRPPKFFGRRPPDVLKDKCTMGFGDPGHCRQGARCKQYHQMEEVNYHPRNYKREECPNRKHTVDDLICHMWHHPDEKNNGQYDSTRLEDMGLNMAKKDPPRVLVEYLKRKLEAKAQASGPAPSRPPANDRPPNDRPPSSDGKRHDARPDNRGKPPAQDQWRPKEYTIGEIVWNYCTKQCQQRDKCTNPECFYFHDRTERRRDPQRYTYQACSTVFDANAQLFTAGAQCESGDECPLAHNFFEVWYHPSVYKTYLCPYEEERAGSCPFGKVCSHAHGAAERRTPETMVPNPQAQNGHHNAHGAEPRDRDRRGNGGDERDRDRNRDRARDRPGSNYGDRANERREESRRSGSGSRGRRDDRDRDDRRDDRGYRDDRGNRRGGYRDDRRRDDREERDDRDRRGRDDRDRRDDGRRSNDRPRQPREEGW